MISRGVLILTRIVSHPRIMRNNIMFGNFTKRNHVVTNLSSLPVDSTIKSITFSPFATGATTRYPINSIPKRLPMSNLNNNLNVQTRFRNNTNLNMIRTLSTMLITSLDKTLIVMINPPSRITHNATSN